MHVHLVQMSLDWEDRHKNFARTERLTADADLAPGDLVVLPELFDSGFSLNTDRTNDDGGETLAFLREFSARTGCTVQGGRTVLGDSEKALNCAPVFSGEGELLAEYAKIHPFSFGREPERFRGGDAVVTYGWGGLTVCPAICYDLRFPELFRLGMLAGAEAFAIGANWPRPRTGHWRALAIARAIENQAFVFAVNRCGDDPHLGYDGNSMVVGPTGEVLGELGDSEEVLSVAIDPAAVRDWRETFPAWRDVRLVGEGNGEWGVGNG
jgi:omega-amidase